jgi:hypothetical protein
MGAGGETIGQWHLTRNGKPYGPFDFLRLVEAVRRNRLSPEDRVWRPGWERWYPAWKVPGLFAPPETDAPVAAGARSEFAAARALEVEDQAADHGSTRSGKTTSVRQATRRNYFARHWRGELSLPVSYWLNGILAALAMYTAAFSFEAFIEAAKVQAGAAMALGLVCFLVATSIVLAWQMVGIWRSATRHAAKGKIFWAGAAKVMVLLGVARSVFDLGGTFVPLIADHIQIAMGDEQIGENHFRLLRNGTELEFAGGLKTGTAKEFERMLEAASQVRVLRLNSYGGRIAEADAIVDLVRKRQLITFVSEHCESACTHIFLAGSQRWLGQRGKLGFHQPSIAGLDKETIANVIKEEGRTLRSLGLPSEFVAKALATPSDDMWQPTHEELLAAHVISGISDGSHFAAPGSPATLSTEEFERRFLKNMPLYVALKRAEPSSYDEMLRRLVAGYREGQAEDEIFAGLRRFVSSAVRKQLPFTSDANLIGYLDVLIGYMEGLKAADPGSCVAVHDPSRGAKGGLARDLSLLFPDMAPKELSVYEAIMKSDGLVGRFMPTKEQVEPYLETVRGRLAGRPDLKLDLISKPTLAPAEYKPFCELMLAFYREVRRLPANQSVAVLRNLFAHADD